VKTPELLAPGGSFLAAYYALEAGADGVYLGLREFSARAAAQNFSLNQLRRIRQLAADRGRRVYVTINTVIREEELGRLRDTLAWLQALRVDGVIVQDLGVCDLVHREFPRLQLHASTQMGVHNESGLREVRGMGVRRAILSRELPLERIRALHAAEPGIELEVFIHGALCYGFSGACLASWALTGRSGNRGECAQVCRSRFVREGAGTEGPGEPEAGHLFSTRDLFLGREVLELARMGVHALKIEGRMKSPEYVFAVTRLYRQVLDRGESLPEAEYEELVRRTQLAFSRTRTTGWMHSPLGSQLLEKGAPGHRGAVMGSVRAVRGRMVELTLEADLSLRDGLGFLDESGAELVGFPVLKIVTAGGGAAKFARKGETVSVEVATDAAAALPRKGQEIRHLSSRFLDLPQPAEGSFALYKIPVELDVRLESNGTLHVKAAGFPPFTAAVSVSAAQARRPFLPILAGLLEESGASAFRPGQVTFSNESGLPDDGIFVRPAELKRFKNELYRFLDSSFPERAGEPEAEPGGNAPAASSPRMDPALIATLEDRARLSPPAAAPIPFATGDPARLDLGHLAQHAGYFWLPLPPVLVEDAAWIRAVSKLAVDHPEARLAVGLNNVSHLAFVSALEACANAWFFADFFLYVANRAALRFLEQRVPRLLFAYEWLEAGEPLPPLGGPRGVPTVRVSSEFSAPLFTSLGCFTRHSTYGGRCAPDCPKDFSAGLRQGKNRFRVLVRDCVTYVFRA
jgi:U32 family peptidase